MWASASLNMCKTLVLQSPRVIRKFGVRDSDGLGVYYLGINVKVTSFVPKTAKT